MITTSDIKPLRNSNIEHQYLPIPVTSQRVSLPLISGVETVARGRGVVTSRRAPPMGGERLFFCVLDLCAFLLWRERTAAKYINRLL